MSIKWQTLAEVENSKTDLRSQPGVCLNFGFTMIELMLVMAIVAVFSAIAVPRYSQSTDRYRADAAARRIEADYKLARNRARITSSTVTIVFDRANNKYSIAGLADLNQTRSNYTVELSEAPYEADLVKAMFDEGSQISFDGYGVPGGEGTVILTVGSQQRTISIAADTGEVTIQ